MDTDRIFLHDRGRLIELSRRYRRPPPPAAPSLASAASPPAAAPSLASAACRCVCRHFDRVESLLGLPDDLGRLLFDAAVAQGLFRPDAAARTIRLFAEAFGASFAAQLNLSGVDFRAETAWPSVIPHLKAITALALDGCHLDAAEASLLAQVATLPALRGLSLRDNCLLDSSLRALTAPWRFRPKASAIRCLDLRDNKYVTDRGLRYLLEVASLAEVVFSASSDLEAGLPRAAALGWRMSRSCRAPPPPATAGWIAQLLRRSGCARPQGRLLLLQRAGRSLPEPAADAAPKKRRLNAAEAAELALR